MKTFDPPSKNIDNTDEYIPTDYLALCRKGRKEARLVALLSLIPGLGQLRNGEKAKASLFFAVALVNASVLGGLIFGEQLKPAIASLAAALHCQPNWTIADPLHQGFMHSPVLWMWIGLTICFVAYAMKDAYEGALQVVRRGSRLPGAQFTIDEATSGSYLAHIAVVIGFLFTVLLCVAPIQPSVQTVQIELSKPEESKPAPKKAPEKAIAPKPKPVVQPKPVVVPPKPVVKPQPKVVPPTPTPVAVAVPTKEPTPLTLAPVESAAPPPVAAPAPSTGGPSGGGNTGGTGAGGNGDAEVDMGPYMRDLQKRIKQHWFPPKGNENKRIKVSFKVFKDGHITKLKLMSSSGVSMADDAALQAVQEAAPFAQLPAGVGDDVDINFTFDYHVFGAGGR